MVLKQIEIIRMKVQLQRAFQPASPVDRREIFAGRTKQITTILSAISQKGQHVILYGERGVGKTSLANLVGSFYDEVFSSHNELIAPRVNCDTTDTFQSVWQKVLEKTQMLYDKRGWEFPDTQIFNTAYFQIQQGNATPSFITQFLEIADRDFVIIIDEFDRLNEGSGRELFADTIKSLSDHAVPTTVMLVGVADNVEELLEDHASIDRALIQVLMPRMSPEELQEIVEKGLSTVGMSWIQGVPGVIAYLSQGLPHYAHLLGLFAGIAALDDNRRQVTEADVRTALAEAIDRAQETVRTAYRKATVSAKVTLYPQVLAACALVHVDDAGYFAPVDIRQHLIALLGRNIVIPTYIGHLHRLSTEAKGSILQKIVSENKPRFRFADALMKPYIIFRSLHEGIITDNDAGFVFTVAGVEHEPTRPIKQRARRVLSQRSKPV